MAIKGNMESVISPVKQRGVYEGYVFIGSNEVSSYDNPCVPPWSSSMNTETRKISSEVFRRCPHLLLRKM